MQTLKKGYSYVTKQLYIDYLSEGYNQLLARRDSTERWIRKHPEHERTGEAKDKLRAMEHILETRFKEKEKKNQDLLERELELLFEEEDDSQLDLVDA